MKDIDFDELDRAVSSVLGGGVPKQDDASSATPAAVADADQDGVVDASEPAVSSQTSPSPQTIDDGATADRVDEPQPPQATTPLAIKRRGKFMDVVHPSSDMNPASTVPITARKSIAPLGDAAPAEEQAPQDSAAAVDDTPVVAEETSSTVVAETVTETELSTSPYEAESTDTAATEDSVESEPVEQNQAETTEDLADETKPTDQPTEDSEKVAPVVDLATPTEPVADPVPSIEGSDEFGASTSTTPETPFLSDAKVEKRPLGGFGDNPEASTDELQQGDENSAASASQTPPPVSLPRELQPDVVMVEAIPDDTQAPADSVETTPVLATVPAAASIDGDTHSLFDTSSYHAPIAHAKKSSTPAWVWWMVGLLLCLAAGAGVGYFLFIAGL